MDWFQEWAKQHKDHLYFVGYRTTELAEFLNVNRRTIQRWIRGTSKPSEAKQEQIRQYLETQK